MLSVASAGEHYADRVLVTDTAGARLLADQLGLPFTEVSTELDGLRDADPEWWVLGKLWAYRLQHQPFVHIDSDAFLWKPLPVRLESAPVLAQNPETFTYSPDSWYRPVLYDEAIQAVSGWAPDEWRWALSRRRNEAVCCGVFGGNAVEFISYYADLGIRMIGEPANQMAWSKVGSRIGDNILVEQFLLSACVEYHSDLLGSEFHRTRVEYLFDSSEEAFDEEAAARAGYTHLIGAAKRNPRLMTRLVARVREDYPQYFERCLQKAAATARAQSGPLDRLGPYSECGGVPQVQENGQLAGGTTKRPNGRPEAPDGSPLFNGFAGASWTDRF